MPTRNEYSLTRNRWDASVSPRIDRAQIFDDNQVISIVNASESFLFDLANIRIGQTIKFDMDREVALAATIQLDPPLLEGLPIGGSFSFHRDENGIKFIPGTFPVPKPDNHHGFVPLDEEPKEDPDDPYGLVGWRDEYLAIDDEEPLIDNPAEDYLGFTENIDDLTPPTVNVVYDQITRGFFGCDHLIKLGTNIVLCSALDKEVIVQLPEATNGTRIAVKKEDLSYNSVYVLDNMGDLVVELYIPQHSAELAAVNGEWIVILSLCPDTINTNVFDLGNLNYFIAIDESEESGDWRDEYFSLDEDEPYAGMAAAMQYFCHDDDEQDYTL
ncbi:MAG: hypothetical protein BWY95_00293 [Bacteroidetes bacterium ADurb.BinA104]|nr:MAG: hypothetical protein BWY95_00293 [Bacteroidetes bacterium ADurb.BinA104]